jgi:hypothetical protein
MQLNEEMSSIIKTDVAMIFIIFPRAHFRPEMCFSFSLIVCLQVTRLSNYLQPTGRSSETLVYTKLYTKTDIEVHVVFVTGKRWQ